MKIESTYEEIQKYFPSHLASILEKKKKSKSKDALENIKYFKFHYDFGIVYQDHNHGLSIEDLFSEERFQKNLERQKDEDKANREISELDFKNEFFSGNNVHMTIYATFKRCSLPSGLDVDLSVFDYNNCPDSFRKQRDRAWESHLEGLKEQDRIASLSPEENDKELQALLNSLVKGSFVAMVGG